MPKVIITSSPRSGTSWLARILEHFVPTGHEFIFQNYGRVDWARWDDVDIEVSYAAGAFLPEIVQMEERPWIVHLVRHPLKVIQSDRAHTAPVCSGNTQGEYLYPGLEGLQDLELAAQYWICHNAIIEQFAHKRYKIEDIGPTEIQQLVRMTGKEIEAPEWVNFFPAVNSNLWDKEYYKTEWEDLPESMYARIREMAYTYDYLKEV